LQAQISSLAQQELSLFRNGTTRPGDTADSLLRRLGVADAEAASFLRRDKLARELLSGRSGKMVQVRADTSGQMDELVARYPTRSAAQFTTHFTRLRITRAGKHFDVRIETAPLAARPWWSIPSSMRPMKLACQTPSLLNWLRFSRLKSTSIGTCAAVTLSR
jgi:hypothetical protein